MDVGMTVTFGLISVIAIIWYIWRKRRMTLFERLRIPGPKPHLICGNLNHSSQQADLSLRWEKKYGKIYGIYMGAWPFLVVSDIEFLKLIQVKEFKNFNNRAKILSDLAVTHEFAHEHMAAKADEKWKKARSVISPAFTSGKLRKMVPIAKEVIDILLDKIDRQNEKTFDIFSLLRKMSFDINSRASFGISTDIQNNDNNQFIHSVYRSFDADGHDFLAKMLIYFPELHPLPKIIRIIRDKIRNKMNSPSVTTIVQLCAELIKLRKENPEAARPDLLQGLIEASKVPSSNDEKESAKEDSLHVPLTEKEVLANAYGFMLAGYDSIGNIAATCVYHLMKNPNVQEILHEEIKNKVKDKVDYDTINSLPYLDRIILETIRMYPISVVANNRMSADKFNYNDINFPKNMNISIALHALNMNPEYWEEPEKFNPERFSPEKGEINSVINQPYGLGPRKCIGMRFAQFILKFTILSLFQRYKFEKPANEKDLEFECTTFFIKPKHGVHVRAIPIQYD